ncbi:MAG: AAA domain-containing protein [Gammaproteobacteria bacterium]|nr:AAA domain-containing protein [Gammaproteobacteria bacterium]
MSTAAQSLHQHIRQELGQVVFGMDNAIEQLVIALIAGGHVLVQGVPGLGKTLLAKSFAQLTLGKFKRIQCTADLMPSDITGIHIYRSDTQAFELIPGPVFADVLLVDEINRAGPKTQSALLQAMEEGKVTIDRTTYSLPNNFMVIASQNPIDFEGTYPLPESQLDRFLMRIDLDYIDAAIEKRILMAYDKPGAAHNEEIAKQLRAVEADVLTEARLQAANITVADPVYDYAVNIGRASRVHPNVQLGISNRGSLSLMRCARARAAIAGKDYVTPDDIKHLCESVMAHRLILTPDASLEGIEAKSVIDSILGQVEVPRE